MMFLDIMCHYYWLGRHELLSPRTCNLIILKPIKQVAVVVFENPVFSSRQKTDDQLNKML